MMNARRGCRAVSPGTESWTLSLMPRDLSRHLWKRQRKDRVVQIIRLVRRSSRTGVSCCSRGFGCDDWVLSVNYLTSDEMWRELQSYWTKRDPHWSHHSLPQCFQFLVTRYRWVLEHQPIHPPGSGHPWHLWSPTSESDDYRTPYSSGNRAW